MRIGFIFTAGLFSIMCVQASAMQIAGESQASCSVSQFAFLVGSWEGQGWFQNGDGTKSIFQASETIKSNLNGKILQMEGLQTVNGLVVNHALTTIAYDSTLQKCTFDSFVDPGTSAPDPTKLYHGNYEVDPAGNGFSWFQSTKPVQIRYTMKIDDLGQWNEIGESSPDGKTWTKFFEQILGRKN